MISVFDLLVISQIPHVGPGRMRLLVSHFGSTCDVLRASAKDIAAIPGFNRRLSAEIVHSIKRSGGSAHHEYAERQLSRLNKINGAIVTYWDQSYPEPLKKIYDPPPFYFQLGEYREEDKYSIALVGTRSPSEYGISVTEQFTRELTRLGITVVSGLARGIDTAAHSAVIHHGGRTIAVTGSGLDVVYPPENRILYQQIVRQGAIVTEYEMGAKPDAVNFPRRNRIISGLSLGTIVVETDLNGGAMITATTALDQNREVFAVPGNIGSKRSRGCHALIKEGRAKLAESVDDILAELSTRLRPLLKSSGKEQPRLPDLTLFEKNIYDQLADDPTHIDRIADMANTPTADALVSLLGLEFKGLVRQFPGKRFART
jgi:DNA processing protein